MELPNFDLLLEMAQKRPEELEALREQMVENVISSARSEYQNRLRGLQFQIDMTRAKSKTPLAACMRISELMYESFSELHFYLNEPLEYQEQRRSRETQQAANVVNLNDYKARKSQE
ncbi:hypothetical protein BTA51_17520 [Hahella sp. CCB-MM4]|uniref:DUF3135 domain-containing protein n=1 Tax=Hahella sp. (strain CCB-MM4) TaxID=1926491 RepID=UPI000B9B5A62|nr:DUF3135 domain-containing protein [Hahella sp. CCB-MM4]OZG72152.1 hypothetical protein BTA51_17520 [Hahella sp. CCB-MM4]